MASQPFPERDERPEAVQLLRNIKEALPEATALLKRIQDHGGYEDRVYRFYHQSFKVYGLQEHTLEIVKRLEALAPPLKRDRHQLHWKEDPSQEKTILHPWFMKIIREGTGQTFELSHNQRWLETTRPILEAFFHAKYFLEMTVRYGAELDAPPAMLPSGWAAVLHLYGMR